MSTPLHIKVGQHWRTRSGRLVRITVDRLEFAALPSWRWACSSSWIVNEEGRAAHSLEDHAEDLMELVVEAPPTASQVQGMDSTIGDL